MRAIKIDSENRAVTEIEISDNEESTLKGMQDAVGGYIALAFDFPDEKNACYVNDEGLLNHPQHFFSHKLGHQPYAGNAIITGINMNNGETVACTLDLKEVQDAVEFYTIRDIQRMISENKL